MVAHAVLKNQDCTLGACMPGGCRRNKAWPQVPNLNIDVLTGDQNERRLGSMASQFISALQA